MRKGFIVVAVILALVVSSYALAQELRTRQFTPIIKQETYTATPSGLLWDPTSADLSVVCTGYVISTDRARGIILNASSTIIRTDASGPTISPAGFLFKGVAGEALYITANDSDAMGTISVSLFGREEQ